MIFDKKLRKGSPKAILQMAGTLTHDNEMLPEYDFAKMSGGIRGKYYKAYREGHTVKIHKDDGNVEIHYFTLEDGAVMLEPDVQEYFPDSESVNNALRSLISLIPDKHQIVKSK